MIHSEEAERGVVGSIMLDAERVIYLCIERGVTIEHFYNPSCRAIFIAAIEMSEAGRAIDILTISGHIKSSPNVEEHIKKELCLEVERILEGTPTSAHAEWYIELLQKFYRAREANEIARNAANSIPKNIEEADEIIGEAASLLSDLLDAEPKKTKQSIIESAKSDWIAASKGQLSGIPSPWPKLNNRMGGLRNGTVCLFAGRAGKGKSSAVATWIQQLGVMNVPVAACCFEDGVSRTYQRIAGIYGDLSVFNLDVGNSTPEDVERGVAALSAVMKQPIFLEDQPMSPEQFSIWAYRMKAKNKVKVIFLDAFKDLMRKEQGIDGDNHASQTLAALAKRLDIPIVVNVHVRKQDQEAARRGARLTKDDIKGSGRIYDDCRQCLILQDLPDNQYEFEIEKNNYGPTGIFPMVRISNRCKWVEEADIVTDSKGMVLK